MDDIGGSGYRYNHKYRGCAVIIVNKNFWRITNEEKIQDPKLTRNGSSLDLKKMKHMFKALDFKVKVYEDLEAKSMTEKIQKASQHKRNKDSDCFALVISSHGEEVEEKKVKGKPQEANIWRHQVIGSDKEPVYIDELLKMFEHTVAKDLANKPKLFFFQACRSRHGPATRNYDYGILMPQKKKNNKPDKKNDTLGNGDYDDLEDGNSSRSDGNPEDIEDINTDWTDSDDEWDSDSDRDDSCFDEDDDLEDAIGAADSGNLPASPDMEEPSTSFTQQVKTATRALTTTDGKGDKHEDQGSSVEAEYLQQAGGDQRSLQRNADGSTQSDSSTPSGDLDRPDVKGRDDRGVKRPSDVDEADTGHSDDTGRLPPSPFDIIPIHCPADCVLVYPVTPGYTAFRKRVIGSRLLDCMNEKESLQMLIKGGDLLQYLTLICDKMSKMNISFEPTMVSSEEYKEMKANMPFKISTIVHHRLRDRVYFKPKANKSVMSAFKKLFL